MGFLGSDVGMMHAVLVVIHVIVCLILAIVVLLQSSKGGGLAGAFGGAGGAPQQLLGSRGMTTLLHKLTIYFAVAFFVTSFLLFITGGSGTAVATSIVGEAAESGQLNLPAQEIPANTPAENPVQVPEGDQGSGSNGS